MASGFPGSIDNFTDPLTTSALNSPSHAGQHQDLNDAVEKIETYMGLVKVIPTAATNGTISATGTVTVGNAVSSVTVTAFSALYDNYKIIYTGGLGSAAQADLRLSLGGITTGYYGAQFGATWNTSAFAGRGINNQASWIYAGFSSTTVAILSVDLFGPFTGTRKYFAGQTQYTNVNEMYGISVGEVTSTASATAFTISPSTGTITGGTIRVYGYRN